MHDTDSDFLRHEPCPKCGSRNNLARYTDGHAYCFGCRHYEPGDNMETETEAREGPRNVEFVAAGEPSEWSSRGITLQSAQKWGFTRSNLNGDPVRLFNYRNSAGQLVWQKVRFQGKDFRSRGEKEDMCLYGQWLWRDGGKRVVVVEGELDAISLSQMQDHKWAVVSVPNGADGAAKALRKQLNWLEQFEEIVLMLDQDEAGQKATDECKLIPFTPGKLKIATLPLKDANEMLMAGRVKETIDAIWGAKVYRPDGLVGVSDIMGDLLKPVEYGLPWCFEDLTKLTYGRRDGEVYGFGAGTGIGKTDFLMQQIAFDITELKQHVGAIFLEQKPVETAKRVAGKIAGKMFHVPDGGWTGEELTRAAGELDGKLFFYDNFGQTDWELVKGHIRYMVVSLGIKLIYLDHLTAMADTGDEKGTLEQIMKEMAGLANELGCIIHFVSHLATPDGKPHEEGGRVMIRHFKGSRAIGFWSFFMFGLERDQQNPDPVIATTTIFRILKDRYTGRSTGKTLLLGFHQESGKLFVREEDPFETKGASDHGFENETPDF
ncbi:toprim domain-containing protein [Sinorhizobium meliloti]|nr:toprim domain-containing protein [Sinorhizobium meliloti]MDX1046890.1 toprim domain-containing protein [Sinorhizobium medicae]MDX0094261.1 toprim domain-containing protein [Sinorhizobium meliloti]MDX0139278.1 toprim domain-containing protein [Sinorhizobium meliloti]MDX0194044.1 toprim domain-containing protein [Sinorhizobium meliloti]